MLVTSLRGHNGTIKGTSILSLSEEVRRKLALVYLNLLIPKFIFEILDNELVCFR